MVVENILDFIGNTPLISLKKLTGRNTGQDTRGRFWCVIPPGDVKVKLVKHL